MASPYAQRSCEGIGVRAKGSDMFELPKWKGIEEAMQDVRLTARDKGLERGILLRKSGERILDMMGTDKSVQFPDWAEKLKRGKDVFIIHGHPGLPAELSDADVKCIHAMGAAGNMAVSGVDDTVSWTSGIDFRHMEEVPVFFREMSAQRFMEDALAYSMARMGERSNKGWAELDERWVVLAHLCNAAYVEAGFLLDYHLRQGSVESALLEKWAAKR